MYNLLSMKHVLTTSDKLIFKKQKYDKREYIILLLKKNNSILNKDETYKSIIDEILKNDINCYAKFIKDYCCNRILNEKPEFKVCFHPSCLKKVKIGNYCDIHQDKKICNFLKIHISIKIYI